MTRRVKSSEATKNVAPAAKKEAASTKRPQTTPKATAAPPEPRKKRSVEPPERPSALAAAARVLAETKKPMTCGELIEVMRAKGYWQSRAGKTPAATLYSAILRDMRNTTSRFQKTARGQFAHA